MRCSVWNYGRYVLAFILVMGASGMKEKRPITRYEMDVARNWFRDTFPPSSEHQESQRSIAAINTIRKLLDETASS